MMRCLLTVTAIGLVAVPALAGPEILPTGSVKGVKYAAYDLATGKLTPLEGPVRSGASVWAATQLSGEFFIQMYFGPGATTLDWGDIAGPQEIGGFSFSYGVGSAVEPPSTLDAVLMFFADENGHNSTGRTLLAAFTIANLPATFVPPEWSAWTILVDLDAQGQGFTIDGSDLDGDGLADFGYTYWFTDYTPAGPDNYIGPVIAGDPNVVPPTAPGIENFFDFFADPNLNEYLDTYWFGALPFAQFYMELFDSNAPGAGCPSPGASGWYCTADITGPSGDPDCVVDLADLALLVGNYPTASGATHEDGDVEPEDGNGVWDPWDGDGDIDLADLAQMLGMYRDDCN